MKFGFFVPVIFVVAACQAEPPQQVELIRAGAGVSEADFAKAVLNNLQAASFSNNREFCGYLVRAADGGLAATPARKGRISSCRADNPPEDLLLLASYHTHGAFEYDTPAEFPSVGDVEADSAEGVDGYIATPGGRLWYVDGEDMVASLLCGVGCMIQDPNFQAGLDGDIAVSYTLGQLRALEG